MQVTGELLERCRKNDRKAHNELYRHCFGQLMGTCLRYASSRDDAHILANNAFLKIVTNLDKYRSEVPFGVWVNRVTINSIIDEFRRDKKRREHMSVTDIQELRSSAAVDFNEAAQAFDAHALETMIQQLPEMSRKVFNLYAIDGYTHKEIADMLGMSDGTSKWHVSFARKSLQQMLSEAMKKMLSVTL